MVVAVLPVLPGTGFWGWGGTSVMEVDGPGCEVFSFLDSRHHGEQETHRYSAFLSDPRTNIVQLLRGMQLA